MAHKVQILIPLVLFFLILSFITYSQNLETSKKPLIFSGDIGLTNNGIDMIPSFSLDKPAFYTFLSIDKGRFGYNPEATFSLDGRPWYVNYWLRYKLIDKERFNTGFRTSFSLFYENLNILENGIEKEIIQAQRYLNFELTPAYNISGNSSISLVYLYSHGLEPVTIKNINFISLNGNFTNIGLGNYFYCKLLTQLYYLNQDSNDGVYFSATFGVVHKKTSLTLSSQINQPITTSIIPNPGFIWNISLTWSFKKSFYPKK